MLVAVPLGVGIGIAVGLLGGGGSVLAVPLLVYVLGEDVETATTISLVVVAAASVAGGLGHARAGQVCWRHAAAFTAAALPGVVAGTVLGGVVNGRVLIATFALVMLGAAIATWRKATSEDHPDDSPLQGHRCPKLRPARDAAAGVVIGFLTGFFGVGGGFLIVPTLAVAFAFSMRCAIGTSLAIITTTSVLGVIVHLGAGRSLDAGLTIALAAGCVAGALAGAHLSARVPQRTLGTAFAGLVAAVAGYLLVSTLLLQGPPGSS